MPNHGHELEKEKEQEMAKRKIEQETPVDAVTPEAVVTNGGNGKSPLEKQQEKVAALEATHNQQLQVQEILKNWMTRKEYTIDEKEAAIMGELYELFPGDHEKVAYLMESKPGRNGKSYMGFTMDEMQATENNLRKAKMQLEFIEKNSNGFAANTTKPGENEGHTPF